MASRSDLCLPIGCRWRWHSFLGFRRKALCGHREGQGTGPNSTLQPLVEGAKPSRFPRKTTYIATLLYGSLATLDAAEVEKNLPQWTSVVIESNRMKAAAEKISFAGGAQGRIKHIIYIIKENRTYDQISAT